MILRFVLDRGFKKHLRRITNYIEEKNKELEKNETEAKEKHNKEHDEAAAKKKSQKEGGERDTEMRSVVYIESSEEQYEGGKSPKGADEDQDFHEDEIEDDDAERKAPKKKLDKDGKEEEEPPHPDEPETKLIF